MAGLRSMVGGVRRRERAGTAKEGWSARNPRHAMLARQELAGRARSVLLMLAAFCEEISDRHVMIINTKKLIKV